MWSADVAATGPGVAVAVDLLDLGVAEAWSLDKGCIGDLGDRSVCRGEQCVWTNGTGSHSCFPVSVTAHVLCISSCLVPAHVQI